MIKNSFLETLLIDGSKVRFMVYIPRDQIEEEDGQTENSLNRSRPFIYSGISLEYERLSSPSS